MKTNRILSSNRLRSLWSILASSILLLGGNISVPAFTADDRDLAWSCWSSSFYYTVGSPPDRAYIRVQEGTGTASWFWEFAEEIELVEDRGDVNMVNLLCKGFIAQHGTDWSWNIYNDDLMWASMAYSRAYQLTGNVNYRTYAKNGFDISFNRGWDAAGGGGLWWNTAKEGKCMCANGPASLAAYYIYQTTGDTSYRTKAQTIYNWMVSRLYIESSGGVLGSIAPGDVADDAGNQGVFAHAAKNLGDTARATKAGDYAKSRWGDTLQPTWPGWSRGGGNGICLRNLVMSGYHDTAYLRRVCDKAWASRNVRGLAISDWTTRSSDTFDKYAWDCSSMVVGLLCVPTTPQVANGRYEIVATTSGNCLDGVNIGTANGTPIQLWGYWGGAGQLWDITDLGNGYFSIRTANGGRSLDCTNNSANNGTPLQLWDYWGGFGQQWEITPAGDGSYKIATRGIKSDGTHSVLDGKDCSGASGTRIELWSWGGGSCQQKWNLIRR